MAIARIVDPDRPRAALGRELRRWLAAELNDPGPFRATVLSGGNSNETALLTSPRGRWVLRRPPARRISATANNLARERRVLTALADEPAPTPKVIAYLDDPAVSERPCLVLEHRPGVPLIDTWPTDWTVGPDAIGAAGRSAVEALAAVHAVDWQAVGLDGFGKPDGYLARQVSRWRSQYEQNEVRDLPLFGQLGAWLDGNRPAEGPPAVLHGDFHLDNCLFTMGPPVQLSAIIDWELSTIGDPLVDLGLLLAFWGADRLETPAMPRIQALSRAPGAPTRRELAEYYEDRSGRSTAALNFYMTLAFFKLAAIVEGAYAQFVSGHEHSEYARSLASDVPRLLDEAARFAELA